MKNLLSTLAMACMLAIIALTASTQQVAAQTSACETIYLHWVNLNTAGVHYPLRVDFTLQNPSTAATSTVSKVTGTGSSSTPTTVYSGPTQPRTLIGLTIVDGQNHVVGTVDLWGDNPAYLPTHVTGKCLKVTWNSSGCPINVYIEEVNC